MAANAIDQIRKAYSERRFAEALAAVRNAIETQAVSGEDWRLVANAGATLCDLYAAARAAALWREAEPARFEAVHFAAQASLKAGALEAALAGAEDMLERFPELANAWFHAGEIFAQAGELDRSIACLRRSFEMNQDFTGAWERITQIKKFSQGDPDIDIIAALPEKSANLGRRFRLSAIYACASMYDDLGEVDRAFELFAEGARIMRELLPEGGDRRGELRRNALAAFTKEIIDAHAGAGFAEASPIFVIGPPRGGTTLVEQILASHPDVIGGGELAALRAATWSLPDYSADDIKAMLEAEGDTAWRRMGERYFALLSEMFGRDRRVVNKDIGSMSNVGLIHLILPKAKIIFVDRDPMDAGWSCYKSHFGPTIDWSYDFEKIARFFEEFSAMKQTWRERMPDLDFEIRYEDIVKEPRRQIDRLLGYCDLAPCEACYEFHETKRQVSTTSMYQVRQPLYSSAVGAWRRYEKHLEPLRDAMSKRGLLRG